MLIKTVFFAHLLTLALAQVPQAPTCYSAGASPATACNQFIETFCTNMARESLLPGNSNSRCYSLPNGNRCDFIAFNTIGNPGAPSSVNCQRVLNGVTGQCRYGGYGKIIPTANTFTVDPNTGRCSQNVQPGS